MAESHHTPAEVEEQEPEVIHDPKMTWTLGIGIALGIVLAFWAAGTVNTRAGQAWSFGTGPKGEVLTGATPAGAEDLGVNTPGSPSSGGPVSPTVGPPEGAASSGRGTVPTPPGPAGNALPASPSGAAGAFRPAVGATPGRTVVAVDRRP